MTGQLACSADELAEPIKEWAESTRKAAYAVLNRSTSEHMEQLLNLGEPTRDPYSTIQEVKRASDLIFSESKYVERGFATQQEEDKIGSLGLKTLAQIATLKMLESRGLGRKEIRHAADICAKSGNSSSPDSIRQTMLDTFFKRQNDVNGRLERGELKPFEQEVAPV